MFEQFEFAQAARWVHILWVIPALFCICAWGIARRKRTLSIFGIDSTRSSDWLRSMRVRRWGRTALLAVAIAFLTLAAVQPRCDPQRTRYKTSARDIAIILDVSRSMLADDLQPSRLERAKLEISRLADQLRGDRIGLVLFAGKAVIQCPLTSNYSYFKRTLKNVSTNSVQQPGTKIGDAVRTTLKDLLGVDRDQDLSAKSEIGQTVLEEAEEEKTRKDKTFADIILITDGEDHDSFPLPAAKRAAALGVGILAVGLGSEKGTPIPWRDENGNLTQLRNREGELVLSKLDASTLMDLVNTSPRGRYLPVKTANFDLVDFFDKTIGQEEGREVHEEQVFWTEIYQPFVLAGLFFYLLGLLLPERPALGQLAVRDEDDANAQAEAA